jgi:hypothetical protein
MRHLPACELVRRIYGYHALPLSRAMHARLLAWPDVAAWVGLESPESNAPWVGRLKSEFIAAPDPAGHWMHWRRPVTTGALTHKLYVSPRPEAVPAIFGRLVQAFDALGVPAFKIGASARDLLRPDKLVAYFASRDHLSAFAEDLSSSLKGIPVHGVPFTAPLDAVGLLSWGYDPEMPGGGSWRLWVAQTLANALAGAPPGSLDETVAHARRVLRSAGVDPDCWEPIASVLP